MYKVRFSLDSFNGKTGWMDQYSKLIDTRADTTVEAGIKEAGTEIISEKYVRRWYEATSGSPFMIVVITRGSGTFKHQHDKMEIFYPQNNKNNVIAIALTQGGRTKLPTKDTQPDISIRTLK